MTWGFDDEHAQLRARVYEERHVVPWECIVITAPPPVCPHVDAAVTAQDIVTLNGETWLLWWYPPGVSIPDQARSMVLRERAWYASRGIQPPFHPWQRLVP